MSHIFISYNQADADFAAILSIHIEKAGIDTWMDKNRLRPGQDWSIEIDDGIQNAHALIVVMSPEAKASEYVTYEWSFALGAGIPVIPVLYRDTTLHPRLARLQYLKFTDTTVRPWEALIDTIKEVVGNSGIHVVRVPRNAPPHVKSAVLALDSANDGDRHGAIRVLAQTDHPSGKEALIAALQHPLQDVRWRAAENLHQEPRTIPVLLEILRQERWGSGYTYGFAAYQLVEMGEPGKEALFGALVDPEIEVSYVDRALANVSSDEVVPRLLTLLKDPEPNNRMRAAYLLRNRRLPEVSQALFDALSDPDEQVRKSIIEAFGGAQYREIDDKEEPFIHAAEAFLIAIRDVSGAVRLAAMIGLERMRPVTCEEELVEMVQNAPVNIALLAHRVLSNAALEHPELREAEIIKKQFTPEAEHSRGDIVFFHENEYMRVTDYLVLSKIEADSIEVYPLKMDDSGVAANISGKTVIQREEFQHVYVTTLKFDALAEDG